MTSLTLAGSNLRDKPHSLNVNLKQAFLTSCSSLSACTPRAVWLLPWASQRTEKVGGATSSACHARQGYGTSICLASVWLLHWDT